MLRSIWGAAVHAGSWWLFARIASEIFSDSPSKDAYGLLCGWWASLYVGQLTGIRLEAFATLLSASISLATLASWRDWGSWFGHDMPPTSLPGWLGVSVLWSLVFGSPIIANACVNKAAGAVTRWHLVCVNTDPRSAE